MTAANYEPLHIDVRSINLGNEVSPESWRVFTPQQQRVLRGMFAGRVIRVRKPKEIDGRLVPAWIDLFPDLDEAMKALGEEIVSDAFNITVDYVNVRLGGVRARNDRTTATNYTTFCKVETLLRLMPARFTWVDLTAVKTSAPAGVGRMAIRSVATTVFLHIIAGNIEYIPNPLDPANPTLRKLTTYLEPRAL